MVRLQTGDFSIYGSIREQVEEMKKRSIPFTCTPGVSSFLGAASSFGVEYTVPEVSQSVIITRMVGRTPVPSRESLRSYAAHQTSMVIFLSVQGIRKVVSELIKGGYKPETPKSSYLQSDLGGRKESNRHVRRYRRKSDRRLELRKRRLLWSVISSEKSFIILSYTTRISNMSTDKLAIIAVTERGRDLAITLTKTVAATIFVPEKHCTEQTNSLTPDFGTAMREIFTKYQALICIMATGIAVRTLAPVIEDKLSDPAVLVMDEHGKFIISLLSGHVGGANELTERIATITGGAAVITTATDRANVAAIDNIAKQLNGYLPDFKTTIKRINGLLAAGKEVGLHIDEPLEIDTRGFTTEEISPQIYISTKYKLPMTTLERIHWYLSNLSSGSVAEKVFQQKR